MVDLEQFRRPVLFLRGELLYTQDKEGVAECDRLLSIIDSAGKCPCGESACTEPWEPDCGLGSSKEHAAVSDVTRQLIERDRRGRIKYGTSLDRTDLSISEWLQHMAEELMDAAGYALAAKREAQQPALVVDDLVVELAWLAGMREYARLSGGLEDEPDATDLAAMRASLTVFARAQGQS